MPKELYRKRVIEFVLFVILPFVIFFGFLFFSALQEKKVWENENYQREIKERSCEVFRKNYIYIITKSMFINAMNYYKINDSLEYEETREFDLENNTTLNMNNCFESYKENDKFRNNLTLDKCEIIDNNGNKISYNDEILNIIKETSKLEYNLIKSDIVVLDNGEHYVITRDDNDTFYLYIYNDLHLHKVISFYRKEIITIKSIN